MHRMMLNTSKIYIESLNSIAKYDKCFSLILTFQLQDKLENVFRKSIAVENEILFEMMCLDPQKVLSFNSFELLLSAWIFLNNERRFI